MSEEMAWRVGMSFEWERAFGDARQLLANADRVTAGGLRQALRDAGYTPVGSSVGTYWLEPGMPTIPLQGDLAPQVKTAIVEAVRQAFAESKEGSR